MALNSGRCLTVGPSLRRYQPVVPRAILQYPVSKGWTVIVFDWLDGKWMQVAGGRVLGFDAGLLRNRTQASRCLDSALVNLIDGSNYWPETLADLVACRNKVKRACKL